MNISGPWLDHPGTQALCLALEDAGHRALLVGGCVRNAILGVAVADIDVATDALPENVSDIAINAGFKVVPTGIEHGTVTVIAKGLAHEVTTFRRDVATDGRHAQVAFGTELREDAARRDFTMNALYADRQGDVVDPLVGLPDLLARRVRFVGHAEDRIREDYLRILRFFRFHAHFGDPGGGLDPEAMAACAANSAGIDTLSRERIGAEMRKLLSADDPAPSVAAMAASGVLAAVLPGADARALPVLIHFEGDTPPDWQRRLVVLGGEDLAQALRLSRAEAARLTIVQAEIGSMVRPEVLGWRHGVQIATDVVLARAAMFEQPLPQDWLQDIRRGAEAQFPVSAADLMPELQGPALGARLRALEARWLESGFSLTRDELLA